MTVIKKMFFITFIGILCMNCSTRTTTQDRFFNFKLNSINYIGVIKNDTIKFYYKPLDGSNVWYVVANIDFVLPNGYEDVFSFGDGIIGVISNNKIVFFKTDNIQWHEIPSMEMTLPEGYQKVFCFWGAWLGVITNNTVHFHWFFTEDGWVFNFGPELNLPNGFKDVFSFQNNEFTLISYYFFEPVGVILDDKIQFYGFNGNIWEIRSNMDMVLPDGVIGAFGHGENNAGIILNGMVNFYEFADNNWHLITCSSPLPSACNVP